MATAAVVARILTQYSDVGSKAAQKDIARLEKKISAFGKKAVKSFALAGVATAAFATKVGMDAVKGAAADEKALAALDVALRNNTNATDSAIVANSKYLDGLELQVAIDNEKLIPALQILATATGDLSQAQALLSLSTDVSAASGKDLSVVSAALAKAVNGNFTALTKLGLPLDANAVKAKDLGALLVQLANISKGQAAASANTFSGRLEILRLRFNQLADKLGIAIMPALELLAGYIESKVVPMLDLWIAKQEIGLNEALQKSVGKIVEVVEAFQDIYAVLQGVNRLLPFGIGGWLKLAVAISGFSTAIGIATAASKSLKNTKLMYTAVRGSEQTVKALKVEMGGLRGVAGRVGVVFGKIGNWASKSTGKLGKLVNVFFKLGKFFLGMNPWVRGILILGAAFAWAAKQFDWFGKKQEKVLLTDQQNLNNKKATEAAMGYETMTQALEKYQKTQEKKINKTKEELAQEKLLRDMTAKTLKDQKAADAAAKLLLKTQTALAKFKNSQGAGLTTKEEDIVQLNAAIALQKRQENAKKADMDRLELLKSLFKTQDDLAKLELVRSDILEEYNKNLKYQNDLMAAYQDDLKITADEIQTLADKWGISAEEAAKYSTVFLALVDEKIDSSDIQSVATAFNIGTAEAKKYLQAVLAIKHGTLDIETLNRLATEWKVPVAEALKYIHYISQINNPTATISDAGVAKLTGTWGLTNAQLSAYIKQIGLPFNYHGSLLTGIESLIAKLKEALELIKKLQAGTSSTAASSTSSSSSSSSSSSAAATAAAAVAADAAKAAASATAAAAYAKAKAAGDMDAAAIAAAGVTPSKLAAAENGAIGAASIAAQLRAAEAAQRAADAAAAQATQLANFRAKEAADEAKYNASREISNAQLDYDEKLRFQAARGVMASTTDSGFKGLQAGGGNTNVYLTVQGSVTTEADLVSTVRQGLLRGQYNGQTLTLEAI